MALSTSTIEKITIANSIGIGILLFRSFWPMEDISSIQPPQQQNSRIPQQTMQPFMSKPTESAKDFAGLLQQTIDPLKQASIDHGQNIELPTEQEMALAIQSNSLTSPETLVVLEKLQDGYAMYNMPFPSLRMPEQRSDTQPIPQSATENTQEVPVEEWIRQTIATLRKEIQAKKESQLGLIPTEQEIQAALRSNSLTSTEMRLVMDMLQNACARYHIAFVPYGSSVPTQQEQLPKVDQRKILQAYFSGQIQRLRLESTNQKIDISSTMPSEELVDKAIETASLNSEESLQVLQALENTYKLLGLQFYRPSTQ